MSDIPSQQEQSKASAEHAAVSHEKPRKSPRSSASSGPAAAAHPAAAVLGTCGKQRSGAEGAAHEEGAQPGRHPQRRRTTAAAPAAAAPDCPPAHVLPSQLRTAGTPANVRPSGGSHGPTACPSRGSPAEPRMSDGVPTKRRLPGSSPGNARASGGTPDKGPTTLGLPTAEATPRRSPRHQVSQQRSPRTASPDTPPSDVSPTAAAARAAARLADGDWFDPLDPVKVRSSPAYRPIELDSKSAFPTPKLPNGMHWFGKDLLHLRWGPCGSGGRLACGDRECSRRLRLTLTLP